MNIPNMQIRNRNDLKVVRYELKCQSKRLNYFTFSKS